MGWSEVGVGDVSNSMKMGVGLINTGSPNSATWQGGPWAIWEEGKCRGARDLFKVASQRCKLLMKRAISKDHSLRETP